MLHTQTLLCGKTEKMGNCWSNPKPFFKNNLHQTVAVNKNASFLNLSDYIFLIAIIIIRLYVVQYTHQGQQNTKWHKTGNTTTTTTINTITTPHKVKEESIFAAGNSAISTNLFIFTHHWSLMRRAVEANAKQHNYLLCYHAIKL